jgi:hypothetical protein
MERSPFARTLMPQREDLLFPSRDETATTKTRLVAVSISKVYRVRVSPLLLFFKVTMVWSVVSNFRQALKYRGGWKGLLEHMYSVRSNLLASFLWIIFYIPSFAISIFMELNCCTRRVVPLSILLALCPHHGLFYIALYF